MAQRYRIERDDKIDLKRTQSSFSDDPKLNKAKQVSRRKDDVKNIQVGIYDIDLAFKAFLEKYNFFILIISGKCFLVQIVSGFKII